MNSKDPIAQIPKRKIKQEACCSSPSAMWYWFDVALIAWGSLGLIGIYWFPLHASSAATILFAAAIGCLANWLKNRTIHCGVTGPLFLVGAFVFLLSDIESHVSSGRSSSSELAYRSSWNGATRSNLGRRSFERFR
jgi:hypothetical protein